MLVSFVNHSSAIDHLGGAERLMIKLVEDWYAADPEFEAFFITKAPRGQIIALVEKRRPDLVVTNTLVAPWGAFAAKVLGIPHAWFVREYGDLDHGLTFVNERGRTLADIGLMSEAVFANSEAIRSHLGRYLEIEKVSVVYPTVEQE